MAFLFYVDGFSQLSTVFDTVPQELTEVHFFRTTLKPGRQLTLTPPEISERLFLYMTFDGIVSFSTEGRKMILSPDNLLLSGKFSAFQLKNKSEMTVTFLIVAVPFFTGMLKTDSLRSFYHSISTIIEPDLFPFKSRLLEIINASSGNFESRAEDEQIIRNFADNYIKKIDRICGQLPLKNMHTRYDILVRIFKAKEYIDFEYCSTELSLKEISSTALLCENAMLFYFKKIFGTSPLQYVISKRLQLAKALLQCTSMPLSMIVPRIGFQNMSSFSRLFRGRLGITPSEFRKMNAGKLRMLGCSALEVCISDGVGLLVKEGMVA